MSETRSQIYRVAIDEILEAIGYEDGCGCIDRRDRDCVFCILKDAIEKAEKVLDT